MGYKTIKKLDNDWLILTIVLLVTQTWRQSQEEAAVSLDKIDIVQKAF